MYIQINLLILDKYVKIRVNHDDNIDCIKEQVAKKYNIYQNFDLLLNNKKIQKIHLVKNDDIIKLVFKTGYIFVESNNKIERIKITLDNMNNINEKIADLKTYLDKLYDNYVLKFNNKILNEDFNNQTLNQIGIKLSLEQNIYNTITLN